MPRTIRIVARLLLAYALTGCTTGEPDLPTLTEGTPTPTAQFQGLQDVAKAFDDCLTDAGFTVSLGDVNDMGPVQVNFWPPGLFVMYEDADGTQGYAQPAAAGGGFAELTTEQQAAWDEFTQAHHAGPTLLVDGADRSEPWAKCLATTGYSSLNILNSVPPPPIDPAELALEVESNNQWAACARDNGWPEVADSPMPTEVGVEPQIILPDRMTEDQLRLLLAACPNFDADKWKQDAAWHQAPHDTLHPPGWLPDPIILFDTASAEFGDLASQTPEQAAALAHWQALMMVLNGARMAYVDGQGE
ncbi:MAG: hypothetical protein LBI33_04775 [Propionibacteriaceae bacterium]|jgi:hypothetical protein|nr:hypothetical protein [Propionibacteriaceae bacterium]